MIMAGIPIDIANRADRYVGACIAVGQALLVVGDDDPALRRAGVRWQIVQQRLVDTASPGASGDWSADDGSIVRSALWDLSQPVVGVMESVPNAIGHVVEYAKRASMRDPDLLIRGIAANELAPSAIRLLEVVRDHSFTDERPNHLPRRVVTDEILATSLETKTKRQRDVLVEIDDDLRWLNEQGYIDAELFIGDSLCRITFAGLVWLRDHQALQSPPPRAQSEHVDFTRVRPATPSDRAPVQEAPGTSVPSVFNATIFPIMIGGPSDTASQVAIAQTVIAEWNAVHGRDNNVMLQAMHWSTDAAPAYGRAPQAIINEQVTDRAAGLIAVFAERFGAPTGDQPSGTAAEIDRLHRRGGIVHIYFSNAKVDRGQLHAEQVQALERFRQASAKNSLHVGYNDQNDLRQQLTKHVAQMAYELMHQHHLRPTVAARVEFGESLAVVVRKLRLRLTAARSVGGEVGRDDALAALTAFRNDATDIAALRDLDAFPTYSAALDDLVADITRVEHFRVTASNVEEFWRVVDLVQRRSLELQRATTDVGGLDAINPMPAIEPTYWTSAHLLPEGRRITSSDSDSINLELSVINDGQGDADIQAVVSKNDRRQTVIVTHPPRVASAERSIFIVKVGRADVAGQQERVSERHVAHVTYQDGAGEHTSVWRYRIEGHGTSLNWTLEDIQETGHRRIDDQ